MFAKRAKTPVDFHNKKCFEFLQKIAGAIAANNVLDGGMTALNYTIGSEERLEFLKNFRDKFSEAHFNQGTNYIDILRFFLLELEKNLDKSQEFLNNPAIKELINMLFDEHSSAALTAMKTRELMPGTLMAAHGEGGGISSLFLAWIAYNAPPRPKSLKQMDIFDSKKLPPVLLLYLNILPIQNDDDPKFRQFMDAIKEQYDFGQIVGMSLPHDLALKNNRTFKASGMFKREDLIKLMSDLVCDVDRAFFLQGGEAMQITRKEVRQMVENGMRILGLDKMQSLGKEEALAVYFHLIKYELVRALTEKYHPAFLSFTTHDKHDRANITSAYHALVQSIEAGEPLTRAGFNAVLFAPEHETVRIRQDQLAILWKGMHTYMQGLKVRGKEIPAWLPDWLERHMPQHGKEWYVKQLNELIDHQAREYNQAKVIKDEMRDKIRDVSMFEKGIKMSANEYLCAVKIKSILLEPDRNMGLLTSEDMKVINGQPALKTLCESLKKDGLLDIEKYLDSTESKYKP